VISAFIGLGSNLGDSRALVTRAIGQLGELSGCHVRKASSLYLTPPWGVQQQPSFINAVVEIETLLPAVELLQQLLTVERAAGRTRDGTRWGPRALDLDILLYGQDIVCTADLRVPHPHMAERAFVLLPMAEIAPAQQVPGLGRVNELLARLDTGECRRLDRETPLRRTGV
jgi:2-amino-4-hydroxy-6-hydroxymethyldihydropteridine diphosphokinase